MAKSQNPMDAFRREQKKKELKKNQQHRQRDKQAKLHELDVDEIRDRLKKLERQVQQNPADGPTRKRKQELEDTLQAALKKQKAMEEEQKEKEEGETVKTTATLEDLNAANRERYQNPENSIYYHPVLNPFGAPPPGRPQMYRVPPPKPTAPARPTAPSRDQIKQQPHERSGGGRRLPAAMPRRQAPTRPQRPGKRPPLPPGPPPPGTIQVPRRPPLPSTGTQVSEPPVPPPAPPVAREMSPVAAAGLPPPPPPPGNAPVPHSPAYEPESSAVGILPTDDVEMDDSSDVGVYPPPDDDDAEEDDDQAEQQLRLRSLVPTTLRVQRTSKPKAPTTAVPRPAPPPPGPALLLAPPLPSATGIKPTKVVSSSVSSDFDAFMEEMKSLGAV